MGFFVDFRCQNCRYEERDIGVGRGKSEFPFLALFRCDNCKTIGSTWINEHQLPLCAHCYHDAVVILPDDTTRVNCPKCGEPALITRKEGAWQ